MSCITEIMALHEVPGRVRFYVPQIKSSPANAASLKEHLRKVPGVYHAKTCPHVGSLIVYFDGQELSKESLHEHIHACRLMEATAGDTSAVPQPPKIVRRAVARRRPAQAVISTKPVLLMDLVKQGLLIAGGNAPGGLGLGITALRTLLAVTRRAH